MPLLLDVVVAESAAVFELFAGENQSLLIGWDTLLVLNFGLDVFDRVTGLDFQCDRFTSQSFDEDLHDGELLSVDNK